MEVTVDFIDANRDELGVEPICRDLQVAPSTYYAAKSRPISARARRDAALIPLLVSIWEANFRVYGVRKLWKAARRAGHDVGRDQVDRLMGLAGIEGLRRGKKRKTTKSDPAAERHPDLVKRVFSAERPNALWVSDLTYVATWSGFAYAYFITDAFSRMIVGWRVASHMRADMVLDALEMARWRRGTSLEGLVSHSDAGSQFTSIRYGEHLDELAPVPAGSGKTNGKVKAHDGGDRQANSALWRIVMVRIAHDPETQLYFERRVKAGQDQARGHPHLEALRRP